MILFIPLARYGSAGEAVLVGALTGLLFFVIYSVFSLIRKNTDNKKDTKEIKQDLASHIGSTVFITNDDYQDLYNDLKEKCNPSNYLEPYRPEKLRQANDIFSKLDQNKDKILELIKLRNQAINTLGITVSSAQVFRKLVEVYTPSHYTGENYDPVKLEIANDVYARILEAENNIIKLEEIAKECGMFQVGYSSALNISSSSNTNQGNCYEQKIQGNSSSEESMKKDRQSLIIVFVSLILISIIVAWCSNSHNKRKQEDTHSYSLVDDRKVFLIKGKQYEISFKIVLTNDYFPSISWNPPSEMRIVSGPKTSYYTLGYINAGHATYDPSCTFLYEIIADRSGSFSICPASVVSDNKTIQIYPFEIRVVK